MYPILYDSVTVGVVPQNNGLGVMSDCISCTVEQERNGIYELVMEYPMDGLHAKELALRRILKVKPNPTDDPQLFRISRIGKVMNGKFSVYAKHISYDLSGYEITSGTAGSAVAACLLLQNNANGYTITTDKTVSATFKIDSPASVKSFFVGKEGSFLDVYGTADIKYDNFNVQFLLHGGSDRGVTIRYGKNLLELSQEMGESNLYTHVLCFYKAEGEAAVVGGKVATGLELDTEKCLVLDMSAEYESAPTVAQLTARATQYKNNNNLTVPSNNVKLDFVQSGELASRVDLFDTVNVYYEALGITRTQMKCIRVKWDAIKEKYIETEFGDAVRTAVDTMVANNAKIAKSPSTSFMEEAIAHATEMMTGNRGGYVILHDSNGDGYPDELLVMNTARIETATKVWRFNLGGLGHSSHGYGGPYDTVALTMDGRINATAITTGTLNANLIKAGVISDQAGNSTIDMTNGAAVMKNFTSVDSFELRTSSGNLLKAHLTHSSSSGTNFALFNNNIENVLLSSRAGGGFSGVLSDVGKITVGMDCSGTSGVLYVNGANEKNRVYSAVDTNGGFIWVYNSSDKTQLSLFCDSTVGGVVKVFNKSGTGTCWLEGDNSSYGGTLSLANTSGVIQTRIWGNGVIYLNNASGTNTINLTASTGLITCVTLRQTSSRKVKKNIKPMEDALKILELEAVSFDYKDEEQGTDRRGFIAEDVAKVIPNLVTPEAEELPSTLDYIGMIPYLQDVIKQQQKQIEELTKRVDTLEKQLSK